MKIIGPIKTDSDVTLNRLRALPRPWQARQTSTLHFGLIVPPSPFVMPYGWEWAHYAPFEGPSMVAGLLKGLGYKVTLLDQREIYDPEDLREKVKDFDMVGITTFGDSYNYLLAACDVIKQSRPDVPLILGGPLISSAPLLIMEQVKADYAVVGEGEMTLTEFMDMYTKNKFAKDIDKIDGLVWKNPDGKWVKNTARAQIRDQDALPFQDFSVWDRFKKDNVIPEIFLSYSRGCIANCTFCYRAFPKLNVKSVERVREEIEYYAQAHKFRFAWWSDLTYITDKEYTHKLANEAWTAHDFRSVIFSRVTGIDVPVLKNLKDKGLDLVLYGMESVSKATLGGYHKGITKNAIVDAIHINREAQVKIGGLFIIGAPQDTKAHMDELIDFCGEFKEVTRVKYLSAIPGTKNYHDFVKSGVIPNELDHLDWLSRERSTEEDIDQPGFIKFTPHLTHQELKDVYRTVNGVIEKRPYDYRKPLNVYLPEPDAKFFKRPVYLGNAKMGGNGIKIFDGDTRMNELAAIEQNSIEETKRLLESMEEQNIKSKDHFRNRSTKYNQSSSWVTDDKLLTEIYDAANIQGDEVVLDIASGTGLVSKQFKGKVKEVIGLDLSAEMAQQAHPYVDSLLIASAENIPLEDNSVDVVVCRQGLQFMNLDKVMVELNRVLKPGGRIVFCHLNAYGINDRADAFKIQALRNPARINFFIPGELETILETHGFQVNKAASYQSRESINQWIHHGASTLEERQAIHQVYRESTEEFKRAHQVEFVGEDIMDTMLFLTVQAQKPEVAAAKAAAPGTQAEVVA